ncbi:fumarate reductase subunit FrdD [Bisgaard Taxon 10/6]|uniref:Fumarate reductase subunit D n=1 Tax=Exercitatus varius TaxID=67857 RepID=A0AAW6QAD6_9PAST|nr:fumarate reductase subunit FrdD [Exercitatus varius]QOF68154.1 fumarate reductase subunit FrdD [Actinobacillus sp. GY-402]MDG2914421.1 fumarate reductase subunit FrdD [Exercitatus varius]MDG2917222.1 fumarate reductase subunit FrdD [Exercitatus varius]MDG2939321.1 fumarate reductase subunit FrdD [Exercitatus varius]MDG2942604.1 fumarate reductase subunit FrdD [Exercitatus varius]
MINTNPKRSNEPPVWLLFSAGGMVSGLAFPVLILILGILLPLGIISPDGIIAFAHHWFGKLVILVLTIFPAWAGLHRIHHGMHDIKVHVPAGGLIFYGLAALYTVVAIWGVASI